MNSYKHKYHKYKSKYIYLKKIKNKLAGGATPAPDDVELEVEFINVLEKDLPKTDYRPHLETLTDAEVDVYEREPFEPPEVQSEETKYIGEQPFDLGSFGLSRAVIRSFSDYSSSDFITLQDTSTGTRTKILDLRTTDDFDDFTERYSFIKNDRLHISWDKVAKKYKGLHIHQLVAEDRLEEAFYRDKSYTSWWTTEYTNNNNIPITQSDTVEFIKPTLVQTKEDKISNPFKATLHTETDFSKKKDNYIHVEQPSDSNKILILDSTESFDRFTYKYSKSKKGEPKINWKKVIRDYRGIYIDKDEGVELSKYRHKRVPSREPSRGKGNKTYSSWWHKNRLKKGVVYIFSK